MIDYIAKLSAEECKAICKLLDGVQLKKRFVNDEYIIEKYHNKLFLKNMTPKEWIRLIRDHIDDSYFRKYVNEWIEKQLLSIVMESVNVSSADVDEMTAYAIVIRKSNFRDCKEIILKLLPFFKQSQVYTANQSQLGAMRSLRLEKQLSETQSALRETEEKLKEAQAEIQSLRGNSPLDIERATIVPSGEYDYLSLCLTYIDNYNKSRINRLADIIDDTISKDFVEDSPAYCYFFAKDGPSDIDHIGVWDWKAIPNRNNPEKDYIETSFRKDIIPIEVFCLEDCRSVEDVVSALKDGIAVKSHSVKLLFVYHFGKYLEGVLCYASDLAQNNGKVTILSGVLNLPVYQIDLSDVLYFDKFSVYKAFDLQRNVGTIKVNDPLVIVKDILSRRISWNVMRQRELTRDQYKKLRDYIVGLPTVELYAEIVAACNCSEDDAKALLESFIEKADAYISLSTSEAEIMTDIIRNNVALYNSCLEVIRQRWEQDNVSQIQQAQSNLSKIKLEAEEYRRIVDERKTELLRLQESISDAKRDMESQEQLAEEVRERITAKMEDARTNAAEFLAQQALTFPGFSFTQSNNSNIPFIASSEVPDDDPEHYDSWEDLIELIEYEFVEAGVGKQFSRGLASELYAAFINKTPVLLAGPYGEEIAKAFSAALCASTPASIKCGGEFSMEAMELCRKSETNVILIMNPFEAAWYHEVLKLISLREKFYILTHPFKEDLVIEPDSLFNYCMPIITDTVIDSVPRGKYLAGLPSEKYTPFAEIKNGNPYNNLWNKFRVGQLAKRQMQTIIDMIHRIESSSRKSFDFIPILSYAYVTEQTDILTEYINSLGNEKKPSPEVLEQISRLVGEE